jgi:hypothetical protein
VSANALVSGVARTFVLRRPKRRNFGKFSKLDEYYIHNDGFVHHFTFHLTPFQSVRVLVAQ